MLLYDMTLGEGGGGGGGGGGGQDLGGREAELEGK